jgi:succinate-acetate transporter protein
MNKLINFLKPTITGDDGKASHRRLSVIYFILLLTYMVLKTATGSIFPEIAWIVVSGGAGLFSGLSIWQQKVNKIKDENEDIHTNETNTTTRKFNRTRN